MRKSMPLTKSDYIDIISELEVNYVEFKVKEFEDFSRWEDLKPVLFLPVINAASADAISNKLLEKFPNIMQVRWNLKGIDQGHYSRTNTKLTRKSK
jgi:hypothetical protein